MHFRNLLVARGFAALSFMRVRANVTENCARRERRQIPHSPRKIHLVFAAALAGIAILSTAVPACAQRSIAGNWLGTFFNGSVKPVGGTSNSVNIAINPAVDPPTLESISIIPSENGGITGTSDGILTLGTEVPFFATGFYSDGSTQDLTTEVTWASSNTAEVTIGANTGLATGVGAGTTAQITASLGGVTSPATLVTVEAGTLEGVAITPATGGVDVGATMQLVAYGNYAVPGATDPWPTVLADITHEVSWASSNPSFASVSSTGVVTGIAAGTTTITVTMPGFSGTPESATVTVVPAPPNWALTGNLFHQTAGQTATLLNDGTVLIAGGEDSDSSNAVLNLAEIYSPSTGQFTPTAGSMVDKRTLATATLLPDGTILIAGGGTTTGGGGAQNTAEIYNPTTGMFTATANNMSLDRVGATATLLNTGLVLIAGGGTSADLYDPSTQTFTPTGPLNVARSYAAATLLQNGEVLIAGGRGSSGALTSAELYDPSAGTFTLLTASMAFAREFHTATLLNDGQVLIAGGTSSADSASTAPGYEELYDPTTQTFLGTGALNAPRIAHNALLLGNGNVLIVGGGAPNNLTGLFGQAFPPQATCEVYDPSTGEFTFTANMSFQRAVFTATLLQSGSVLAAGGEGIVLYPAPAEIYTATSTPPTTPTVTVSPSPSTITNAQSTMVTVTVSGGTGNPTPTGSVTITSGTYTSAATTLTSGSAVITVPGSSLAVATDTLTATYTPDSTSASIYNSATGTNTITVTAAASPSFALTNNGPITFEASATTGRIVN